MHKVFYRDWNASRYVPLAFLFSRLSAPFSSTLASLRVNPNHITLAAALSGFLATVAVFTGTWVLAGFLLLLSLILDHADGQVARTTDRRTSLGGYLDTLFDLSVDAILLGSAVAWGILNDDRIALLALFGLLSYVLLELINRHGGHTLILEALRAQDFRPSDEPPTIRGPFPIVPHRDLNVAILVFGLFTGYLDWALAALTVWWSAWAFKRISNDIRRPQDTRGVLHDFSHGDCH